MELKKKLGFSQLLGGRVGQDQSCENSQLFFPNESFPKKKGRLKKQIKYRVVTKILRK